MNGAGILFGARQRFPGVGRFEHRVAATSQRLRHHPAKLFLVLHHQDGFRSPQGRRIQLWFLHFGPLGFDAGQVYPEARTETRLAIHPDSRIV